MLYALFFASGIAGLIYQVSWVRLFGNVFGNTVYSASLVTAVFMLGLGAGSLLAGGWADRRVSRPGGPRTLLGAYGVAELAIGGIGLGLALLLPRLGVFSAAVSSYSRAANGWYEPSLSSQAVRYASAILLVAPPALAMGATLTLLVRFVISRPAHVREVGARVALLYGANTAGAALGALVTDAYLVPRVGIFGAQLVAVAANVLVGVSALVLASRTERGVVPAEAHEPLPLVDASPSTEPLPERDTRTVLAGASVALALSGFAALGMEIVWFRFLSVTIGAYRVVFSWVLTTILVGLWLGAWIGGALHKRTGRAIELFVAAQGLVAVTALVAMIGFTVQPLTPSGALKSIVAVVALPSFLMGFSFPLVSAHVQASLGSVGRRTGWLYSANTIGSVLGSLLAGFVVAPALGSPRSFALFAFAAAVAPIALVVTTPREKRTRLVRLLATMTTGASAVGIGLWLMLPSRHLYWSFFQEPPLDEEVLDLREGPNDLVVVLDREAEGRLLMTNGHPMSGTNLRSQRYMRAFAHLPLLMTERPEHALVICFGVGTTLHATSLHPSLTRVDVADLSRNVLSHASFFERSNGRVLQDPRVSVFVEDGRQHLRQVPSGFYDLVTLEPPPLPFAGVASLFSRDFYELAKSHLKPTGFVTQWLPVYDLPPDATLSLVRAFVDAFPSSALLSGYTNELILIGTPQPSLVFDLDRVEAALASRPRVAADLKTVRMGSLTDLAATFVADAETLRRVTEGVPPVTDDRPVMEYTFGRAPEAPKALFGHARAGLPTFCPRCTVTRDGVVAADPRLHGLLERLAILERLYGTERFRKNVIPFPLSSRLSASEAEALEESDYLRSVFAKRPAP